MALPGPARPGGAEREGTAWGGRECDQDGQHQWRDALPHAQQAWSIDHIDPAIGRANHHMLTRIAEIMLENDQCALEIHGETGDAKAAPRQLVAYLDMNRTSQVREIMDRLAEYRAQECMKALIELEQRFIGTEEQRNAR